MNQNIEREVISIPASGTTDIIYKYKVHAHPDKSTGYNYKEALYYTFRKKGGVMEKLFTLDFIVSLDPYDPSDIDVHIQNTDKKQRVLDYIEERMASFGFDHLDTNYKFYILKEEIDLPHYPKRPRQNNHCYFTLREIFSGKGYIENSTDESYITYNRNNNITDEPGTGTGRIEGTLQRVLVNKYERSLEARKDCLSYHGYICSVCGFESEHEYGEFAKDIIHVHHIKRLSEIGKEYTVDPILELRPVCPNCHAVIHSRIPAYEVEELKALLKNNKHGKSMI